MDCSVESSRIGSSTKFLFGHKIRLLYCSWYMENDVEKTSLQAVVMLVVRVSCVKL